VGSILGAILGAIGSFLAKWLTGRQARKDQIELGQEQQRNKMLEPTPLLAAGSRRQNPSLEGTVKWRRTLTVARSSLLFLVLLAAACSPTPPQPTPPSAAPVPKEYTCEQNRAAAADFRKLPSGSMLRTFLDDFRIERKALRAFHGLPEPAPCPDSVS
jgi:hypothetical protein